MTAAFSIEPVWIGELAVLDALDVVGGERREDHDPDDRDEPAQAVTRQEDVQERRGKDADQAHEQDAAKRGQRALGHVAVDRRRTEHRGRGQERRHDRGLRVAGDDQPDGQAQAGGVDEEQAERDGRADPVDPQLIPITSASCAMISTKKFSAANPTSLAFDWTTKATPALIDQADEHPHEGLGQERLGEPGIGLDAEGRRCRGSRPGGACPG